MQGSRGRLGFSLSSWTPKRGSQSTNSGSPCAIPAHVHELAEMQCEISEAEINAHRERDEDLAYAIDIVMSLSRPRANFQSPPELPHSLNPLIQPWVVPKRPAPWSPQWERFDLPPRH